MVGRIGKEIGEQVEIERVAVPGLTKREALAMALETMLTRRNALLGLDMASLGVSEKLIGERRKIEEWLEYVRENPDYRSAFEKHHKAVSI